MIHNDGAHTEQYKILYRATVYQRVVAYIYITTDNCRGGPIRAMHHHPILYIGKTPYTDRIHVATYDGVEPDGAVFTEFYIAHYRRILGYKTTVCYLRMNSFHRKDNWHNNVLKNGISQL